MTVEPPPQARSLVGRAEEFDSLVRLVGLGDGWPGGGGAVLLAGDAGVGKTRILTELAGRAREAGWHVLVGHCLDFAGDSLPYVPFTELFGRLARDTPILSDTLLHDAPALARLLPGKRLITASDEGDRQGAHTREELFEAVYGALRLAARSAPVLLVIEDVHWADPSTRDLLRFLFTRQPPEAVSVVVSYRADDLHRRHPLRADAAEWARLPGVARLFLAPLPDDAVLAMVHELQPEGLPETSLRSIVRRAEGNAFFVEELVVAARRGQLMLSADLADLLLVHLDALDADARTVLRAVSVAGRRVGHALLAQVIGSDGPDLDLALRAAVDRGLLVAQPEGYAFRHALLAEAIYDDLLPGERIRWHQAYADVLRSGKAEGTAAELARHAFAANDVSTALNAAIRAGDEAMTVGGPAEGTSHYEMALGLLAQPGVAREEGIDPVDVALRANEAAIAAGTLHRALALVQEQLHQLPPDADPVQRALLLHAVASTALLDDTPIDALEYTTEALHLMPEVGPLRARVLATHARANRARDREEEAWRWATAAVELARELNLPAVLADATTTLARLTPDLAPDRAEQAEQSLRTSIAQAREGADVAAELRSSHGLGTLLYELGRLEEARGAYQQAADRAVRMRRPWAPYGLDGRSMAAVVSYIRGEWETVLQLVDVGAEHPTMLARAMLGGVGMAVAAGRGQTAALALLPKARPAWDREGFVAVTCGSAAIDLYADSGDLDGAIRVHDEVVELVSRLWVNPVFQARIRLSGLLLGQLATAARQAGSAERAALLERGDLLQEAAIQADAKAARRGPESQAWLTRVHAEHLRLQWLCAADGAERVAPMVMVQAWEDTAGAFDRFGHVFEAARSRARLVRALRNAGEATRAEAELARAMEVAKTLGARPLLSELRAGGAQPIGGSEDRSRELTAREQEVLALVAQGRSNRQIADVLYISAKTVSVHVSNILAKLEAAGRTEAVAVARRRGLLTDDSGAQLASER
ncbi:MAG TPA: AAA family ATPase [Frankiaceae bacterium]|jgi:ATP/maltotriose-dependent transcriptional regulator MalT|nr:AAA family ATPase [Frankiaceae bacterium]